MAFNFDEHIDRRHSDSEKWNKYPESVIPMWVADTDFRSPQCITDALTDRIQHGVFGYGSEPHGLTAAVIDYLAARYNWHIEPTWLVFIPGVATGLNISVRACCEQGSGTIAPTPIYPPFRHAAHLAGRSQINAPLTLTHDRWVVNLNALSTQLQGNEKLLLLCNPQNPGGTVYRREELEQHLAFAQQHDLIVCSDEIHCDLLLTQNLRHIPFATLSDDAARRSITLMSPSKTWNIAGLGASIAIIPDATLRKRFIRARQGIVPQVDILALTAAEAALRGGLPWLEAQCHYLRQNRDRLCSVINQIPGMSVIPPEGGYLAWVDCSGLPSEDPWAFFLAAGLGFSRGQDFGEQKFVRINFGCTRATLEEAIARMHRAISTL